MNELLMAAEPVAEKYSDLTVAALGLAVVFIGLICIIFICWLFGKIFSSVSKKTEKETATEKVPTAELTAEEKGAVVAAVSAVIAEELGTDVSALRIHSFKKI